MPGFLPLVEERAASGGLSRLLALEFFIYIAGAVKIGSKLLTAILLSSTARPISCSNRAARWALHPLLFVPVIRLHSRMTIPAW